MKPCDVLFLSAHPDDAEFGAGGTLLQLSKKYKVTNLIFTLGEAGTYGNPKTRKQEALKAGKTGGYNIEILNYKDTHLEADQTTTRKLASIIRACKPTLIFSPYHTNHNDHHDGKGHQDHLVLGQIVSAAARLAKFKNADTPGKAHDAQRIIYYMIPSYVKPTVLVDITKEIPELTKLWKCHTSQTKLRGGKVLEILKNHRYHNDRYVERFIIEEPAIITSQELFLRKK